MADEEGLVKYGIDEALVQALVKEAGLTPEQALVKVADGEGEGMLKEARLKREQ